MKTPWPCRDCRHRVLLHRVTAYGQAFNRIDCEYGQRPDADGRCIDVWPKFVAEETPLDTSQGKC